MPLLHRRTRYLFLVCLLVGLFAVQSVAAAHPTRPAYGKACANSRHSVAASQEERCAQALTDVSCRMRTGDVLCGLLSRLQAAAGNAAVVKKQAGTIPWRLLWNLICGGKLTPLPQPEPRPEEPVPAPQPEPEPAKPSPQPEPEEPVAQPEPEPEEPAPQPEPEEPAPTPGVSGLTPAEHHMLDLVNTERIKAGLAPLKVDMELVRLARLKSEDMIKNGYFAHYSPTYGSPFDMMKAAGITYRIAGENLAGAPTVERAHSGLMNSPGHRANILHPAFTHVGIGIVSGGPYGMMCTQMFIGR